MKEINIEGKLLLFLFFLSEKLVLLIFIGVFVVIITLTFLTIVRRIWCRMWAIDESRCGRLFSPLLKIPFRDYGVSSARLFWVTSPTLQFPKKQNVAKRDDKREFNLPVP